MRKIMTLLISLLILSMSALSGCTDSNVPTNHGNSSNKDASHIIGIWTNVTTSINLSGVNRSTMRVYNFTDSMFNYSSYYIVGTQGYYSFVKGIFQLKDGHVILINATRVPPVNYTFQYSFNNNYTSLTLINKSGRYSVYWKS